MPRMGEARWNEDFRENNPKNLAVLMLFFSFFFFISSVVVKIISISFRD